MRLILLFGMFVSVSVNLLAQPSLAASPRLVQGYGQLPIAFEANQGQSDSNVKFLSHGLGYSLFLTSDETVLTLRDGASPELLAPNSQTSSPKVPPKTMSAVLRMKLLDVNAEAEVTGLDKLPGRSNYFVGNDPKKWHTDVPQFAKVRYANIYPGTDLIYYGHGKEMEYDFVLQPGANPQRIRLSIKGADRLRLAHGDVVLTSAAGTVHLRSPQLYQEVNGVRRKVHGQYIIRRNGEIGFDVAAYDRTRVLVIDPVLAYSTFLGGTFHDVGNSIAVDSTGSAYVTGAAQSCDFPTVNPIQGGCNPGHSFAFVTKLDADGSSLVYSTFLGGNGDNSGNGIVVDAAGNAYVTGSTSGTFPTSNAIQPAPQGGNDAFVTKINAAGNALVYSTYLGGSSDDSGRGVVVDSAGNAYVTGATSSNNFPTKNALQVAPGGNSDAFVTKMNAAGSALLFSTYLGGSFDDFGQSVALDSARRVYVTGKTLSANFPTKNALQPTLNGSADAFVTKISAAGGALVYSTYLGGSQVDGGNAIAVDSAFNAIVTGVTTSPDFPTKNAINPSFGGSTDAFVSKINPADSAIVYSTYFIGLFPTYDDSGNGVAVDSAGNAYIVGGTYLFGSVPEDVFIETISPAGALASSYGLRWGYGSAIALDKVGSIYVTGLTYAKQYPSTTLAFQKTIKFPTTHAVVSKIAQQRLITASPEKVSFSRVVLGSSMSKNFTVTNQGAVPLTINRIYVAGVNPGEYSETNTCGSTLAASTSCTVSVTFTPTTKGLKPAVVGVSSSDAASPIAIQLGGNGSVVSLSPSTLSFGKVAVATTSSSQIITLTNVGSTPLNISSIEMNGTDFGDFSQVNTCGTSLGAHASCTMNVKFTPAVLGKRSAFININDDGGASPQRVNLSGTGT